MKETEIDIYIFFLKNISDRYYIFYDVRDRFLSYN